MCRVSLGEGNGTPLQYSYLENPMDGGACSILSTYHPGEFIFQCPIFLPFRTVHGVLKAEY